jgi:hypothetical protein
MVWTNTETGELVEATVIDDDGHFAFPLPETGNYRLTRLRYDDPSPNKIPMKELLATAPGYRGSYDRPREGLPSAEYTPSRRDAEVTVTVDRDAIFNIGEIIWNYEMNLEVGRITHFEIYRSIRETFEPFVSASPAARLDWVNVERPR